MTTVRVSRRELALLCRYVLVQADLPDGFVTAGGRLATCAEIWMGTGLRWLQDNIASLCGASAERIETTIGDHGGEVAAHGESLLLAGVIAVDLATIAAHRSPSARVRIREAAGTDLAPALVAVASQRGLAALTWGAAGDGDGRWVAAGGPASPFAWLSASRPPHVVSDVDMACTMVEPHTGRQPPAIRDGTQEGVMVDMDVWVALLDRVGGTLPPDGRGRLTIADDRLLHDAGPGAGMVHDDD